VPLGAVLALASKLIAVRVGMVVADSVKLATGGACVVMLSWKLPLLAR